MKRRLLPAVLVVVALLATACAPSTGAGTGTADTRPLNQITPLTDPKSHQGPSTAVLPARAIKPVGAKPTPKLPVTLTSADPTGEREVTVTDISRIVPVDLAGTLSATLWGLGLGEYQVGRDMSTTFPGPDKLPLVTSGGHSVNAEAIIALKPTVVITDGTVGPIDVIQQLRDVGIPVVFVKRQASFAGAASLARDVAKVLGVPETGEQLAETIDREVKETMAQIGEIAPKAAADKLRIVFLYIRGSSGIYYLFGTESGTDQLIRGLGGVDVAGELNWGGMKPLTDEAMVAANPDLILVMTRGIESAGGVDGLLQAKPAIALTNAGKNRRFVDMSDGDILSFGPRSADILAALARAIYAPS